MRTRVARGLVVDRSAWLNLGADMTYFTPSTSHPGHGRLGEHERVPGDVIKMLLVNTGYRARVPYDGICVSTSYSLPTPPMACPRPVLVGGPVRPLVETRAHS